MELMERENLALSKKFGQNFLISRAIRVKLQELLGSLEGKRVWEIGPGLGSLTAILLENGADVVAFELDYGFCRLLREEAFVNHPRFHLVEGDFLKRWIELYAQEGTPDVICGNLPYNVGSIAIARLVRSQVLPPRMLFTLQLEVAQRLAASEGSKLWSTLSIRVQNQYQVEQAFSIAPGAFFPAPQVDSAVVELTKRSESLVPTELYNTFDRLLDVLFAQRRKTVRNNLLNSTFKQDYSKAALLASLEASGIGESQRPEELSIELIIELSRALETATL